MKILFLTLSIIATSSTFGQKDYARTIMDTLCSDYYSGRGYVNDGVEKAGDFLVNELKNIQPGDRLILWKNKKKSDNYPEITLKVFKKNADK